MKTVRGRRNEIDFPLLLFGLRDRPGKPRSTPFCKARPGAHRADAAARFALCLPNKAHLCVCARLCRGFQPSPQRRFLGGTAREACPWRDPGFLGLGFVHFCFVFAWTLDGGREREAPCFTGAPRAPLRSRRTRSAAPRWAGLGSRPLSCSLTALGPLTAGRQLPPRHVVPLVGGPGWSCFAEGEGGARPPWLSGQGEVGPESSRGL